MNATAVNLAVRYSLDSQPRATAPSRQMLDEVQRKRLVGEVESRRLLAEGWELARQGRQAQAEACYRQAFATSPHHYLTQCARQYIAGGDYEFGWKTLGAQLNTHWHGYTPPRWDGQSLDGTLVITPDDGLGDQIMLARFYRAIKARGVSRVVAMTPMPLARLFGRVAGIDAVFATDRKPKSATYTPFPECPEAWINTNALPSIFGIRRDSLPVAPYIEADAGNVDYWRAKLPQQGFRVCLAWRTCVTADDPERRSFPLATLAPLWKVPGVSFVSLQRAGVDEHEARSSPLPITCPGYRDLADVAAVIASSDLVIGTDVCCANLAGAMGKRMLLITDTTTDFRWEHGWYPTARVFKQQTLGDWSAPIEAAARALAEIAAR